MQAKPQNVSKESHFKQQENSKAVKNVTKNNKVSNKQKDYKVKFQDQNDLKNIHLTQETKSENDKEDTNKLIRDLEHKSINKDMYAFDIDADNKKDSINIQDYNQITLNEKAVCSLSSSGAQKINNIRTRYDSDAGSHYRSPSQEKADEETYAIISSPKSQNN